MPIFRGSDLPKEFVTPKYSKAYGSLATGVSIEVGPLWFGDNEGAVFHQHPQEQMMYVLKGNVKVEFENESQVLGVGELVHMPSNVLHRVTGTNGGGLVLSCKNIVDGAGHRI